MPHFLFSYLLFFLLIFPCCFESSGHLWGRKRPLGEVRCVLDCVCVCLWERVSLAEVSSPETAEQKGLWLTGLTFPFVLFSPFLHHQLPPPLFWTPKVESVQTCSQIVEKKKKKTFPKIVWAGKNKHLNSPLVLMDKWIRAKERDTRDSIKERRYTREIAVFNMADIMRVMCFS